MKNLTGVSIIMPAYNAEKTITHSIDSVLKQTYSSFELIVVNDASRDRTVEIVNEYVLSDHRVKLLDNEENCGVSASRNRGVQAAQYEWIAFLDSDDCWVENKLEKQVELIALHPNCSLFFTGTGYMDEDGKLSAYTLHVPQTVTYRDILKQNVVSCSSVLAKRSALLAHPMPQKQMLHEDMATWLEILKTDQVAMGIDEPLLLYRISRNSKSGNKLKAAKMQWRTYRHCKVPLHVSVVSFAIYAVRNIKKYGSIKKQAWQALSKEAE
ncbi:MAG: glycosyltransferase family 2 protein [Clostridia bacterium]|nr:glycosyltransferase family 2 protein [Clostridia bacterium]